MSTSDFFGLNSPGGLQDFANSSTNKFCTPSDILTNLQPNLEDTNFPSSSSNYSPIISPTRYPTNSNSFRSSLPTTSNDCSSNSLTSSSPGDFCGNNSTFTLEQTEFNAAVNHSTLNGTPSQNNDLYWANLQSLLAIQAVQDSQNPLGSLLPSTSHVHDNWNSSASLVNIPEELQLERAARFHRSAASIYEATCTWRGALPRRTAKPSGYSSKVFLGGIPWKTSEEHLIEGFKQFRPIQVEWPGKEKEISPKYPKGYVFIIFESEKNVRDLLQACTTDYANSGNLYFKFISKSVKEKYVQVIPWPLDDSNWMKGRTQKLDIRKTVFVGALHGLINAEGLAKIMNDLFGGVVYTGIDIDKYRYPIGSGRVSFNNPHSYMRAVSAAFVEIKTFKFCKKVQVDPYLENSPCSGCGDSHGPYFCRNTLCFCYFCRTCWQRRHNFEIRHHQPLMRISKNNPGLGMTNAANDLPIDPSILSDW